MLQTEGWAIPSRPGWDLGASWPGDWEAWRAAGLLAPGGVGFHGDAGDGCGDHRDARADEMCKLGDLSFIVIILVR